MAAQLNHSFKKTTLQTAIETQQLITAPSSSSAPKGGLGISTLLFCRPSNPLLRALSRNLHTSLIEGLLLLLTRGSNGSYSLGLYGSLPDLGRSGTNKAKERKKHTEESEDRCGETGGDFRHLLDGLGNVKGGKVWL